MKCSNNTLNKAQMTTDEERLILLPPKPAQPEEPQPKPDDGKRRIICKNVAYLIIQRLMEAYRAAQLEVPRDFLKESYALPATGIASHAIGSLKQKKQVPDPSSFATWRKQHERAQQEQVQGQADAAAGPSRSMPPPKKKSKR